MGVEGGAGPRSESVITSAASLRAPVITGLASARPFVITDAPPPQPLVITAAAGLLLALLAAAFAAGGGRAAAAAGIGAAAGVALYHARFGFTSGWRRLLREGRSSGVRAQLVLIGLASAVAWPLIAGGAASGWVLPMGVASAVGAFGFGVGMQLGGGCASGTLYTVGGGSSRMAVTLAFFVAGSVLATAQGEAWAALPRTRAGVSAIQALGAGWGLAALAAFLGALWWAAVAWERRAHGAVEGFGRTASWVRGPWSPLAGAVALAGVCVLCFAVLGRPWGITSAFALWGAKAAGAAGIGVEDWAYWGGWRAAQLAAPVLADETSAMNVGIVLGALGAAGAAGRFAPVARLGLREALTAAVGGLLMGYGARLAYGCNIGAYLGGLTSGSLHGVWWLAWGFLGSGLGVWLRGRLGMDGEARR